MPAFGRLPDGVAEGNDNPAVMKELMHKLLMRVRPYYLYQAD
jgi:L-lysine 2,3-aminomutase